MHAQSREWQMAQESPGKLLWGGALKGGNWARRKRLVCIQTANYSTSRGCGHTHRLMIQQVLNTNNAATFTLWEKSRGHQRNFTFHFSGSPSISPSSEPVSTVSCLAWGEMHWDVPEAGYPWTPSHALRTSSPRRYELPLKLTKYDSA